MSSPHVSRRTVARGAAWAAPVAVVSVAAPAYAASSAAPTAVINSLCICGTSTTSNRKYRISVTFTNPDTTSAYNLSDMSVAIGNQTGLTVTSSPAAVVAAGPATTTLQLSFTKGNNSSFTSVTLTYTATRASTGTTYAPVPVTLNTATAGTCTNPTC